MHTDSSASLTYFASRSASECTATVLMPSSRQARWILRAISPRLAIRTFPNMPSWLSMRRGWKSADDEQRLAVLDRLAVFHQDGLDGAGLIGLDLVQELHGLDDA